MTFTKGRGAQKNTGNRFAREQKAESFYEGAEADSTRTKLFMESPKTIVNKVSSPDVGMEYSVNPYQGCEHGCAYCYARNSHHYWGFGAGLEFERNIVVKKNAPRLLRQTFESKSWKGDPIALSGNTDCYQPLERKFQLTRQLLEVCWEFRNPVGIITKNRLVLRDIDLLEQLAVENLVVVNLSINAVQEEVIRKLEPRTSPYKQRLQVIEKLSQRGIPVNVLVAPVIPFINSMDMPTILRDTAQVGALKAGYIVVRLNGDVSSVFANWLDHHFPDRKKRVLNTIKALHGGQVNDSRFSTRMRGEGPWAEHFRSLFRVYKNKYFSNKTLPKLDRSKFRKKGQLKLSL